MMGQPKNKQLKYYEDFRPYLEKENNERPMILLDWVQAPNSHHFV